LRLEPPELPHVFQDEVVLSYVNGNVVGTDEFLQEAPPFKKLVLSVPWLVRCKQENPGIQLPLAFFDNASFSDDALQVFAASLPRTCMRWGETNYCQNRQRQLE